MSQIQPRNRNACMRLAFVALLGACLQLPLSGATSAQTQTCCRISTNDEYDVDCDPDPHATRLRWQRSCLRYGLVAGTAEALSALSDEAGISAADRLTADGVRRVIERSFSTWQDVVCGGGGTGFYFQQMAEALDESEVGFQLGVRSEIAIAARSAEEWRALRYDPAIYAKTVLYFDSDSGEIFDVDIQINLGLGPYADCRSDCAGGVVDLGNMLTHEIGHLLGLAHVPEPDSTLFATSPVSETAKRTLLASDAACICDAYPAKALSESQCSDASPEACSCGPAPIYGRSRQMKMVSNTRASSCSVSQPGGDGTLGWPMFMLVGVCLCSRIKRRARLVRHV